MTGELFVRLDCTHAALSSKALLATMLLKSAISLVLPPLYVDSASLGRAMLQSSRGFTSGLNRVMEAASAAADVAVVVLVVVVADAAAAAVAGFGDTLMWKLLMTKLVDTLGCRRVMTARKVSSTVGCSWKSTVPLKELNTPAGGMRDNDIRHNHAGFKPESSTCSLQA